MKTVFFLVLSFVPWRSDGPSSIAVVPVPYEERNDCVEAGDVWIEAQGKESAFILSTYACLPTEVPE